MKIALLKSTLSGGGGLEKYALRLIDALKKKGHEVTPVSFCPSSLLSFRKVKKCDALCQKYLLEHPFDAVFGMCRNSYQTHLRLGNGVHAAYLENRKKNESFLKRVSFAINPLHQTILSIEKQALHSPDLKKLYVNSFMVKEEVLRFYQTDPSKIVVVHNGVEWLEMESDFQLYPSHYKKSEVYQLLFVGHNFHRKGLEPLLKALALCKEPYHLTALGHERDLSYFLNLVKKLGIEKKVNFAGKVSSVRPFYQKADALVIPSFYDPFANVTVEALAMGLFVISSKQNGGHEVLTSENGAIFDSFDPESMAQTLRRAFSHFKTEERASGIRKNVRHLDFAKQLEVLTDL